MRWPSAALGGGGRGGGGLAQSLKHSPPQHPPTHPPTPPSSDAFLATCLTVPWLVSAVQEAASAACHAAWQIDAAGRARGAPRADDANGVYAADHPSVVAAAAEAALRGALGTFECLLTVWLAHCVAFPALRLPQADMARALLLHGDVQAAKERSGFAALLVDRLLELRSRQEELEERQHAAIGGRIA